MGRTPKPPGLDAAMGNPGRRPEKKPPSRPVSVGSAAMPKWMARGNDWREARKVWEATAPILIRLNVLAASDSEAFARYCVHAADWVRITRQLAKEGETQTVPTVAGGDFIRIHPLVKRRDGIEKHLLEAEDRFGLSPRHRIALFRDMNATGAPVGDLFGYRGGEPTPAGEVAHPPGAMAHDDDIIGFARVEPVGRPN